MTTIVELAAAVAAGLAVGAIHYRAMENAVRAHLAGASAGVQLMRLAARLALVAALFWTAAQFGAVVLLVVLASFTASRLALQRKFLGKP